MDETPTFVDPELISTGALLKERGLVPPDPRTTDISAVREAQDRLGQFLAEKVAPVAVERDLAVSGAGGPIPCRLYIPDASAPPPLLVYLHGGGFAYGSAHAWDGLMRDLARGAGVAILNVDYRLAPEHKFPSGLTDVLDVIRDAHKSGASWGADPTRMAAGGDSAGANLALAAAMTLRDSADRTLSALLLFYGVYSGNTASASWTTLGTGAYGLSQAQMEWVWATYLETPEHRNDWRAAPLSGNLRGLPPVQQIIGSLDPLLDDAHALRRGLNAAGVSNDLKIYPGVNHGFVRFNHWIGAAGLAVDDAAAALRRELGSGK